MLRALLVTSMVLVVGATAVLTSSAAPDDAPSATATTPALVYSEIYFDHALLPDRTGWFAVPIGVDRPAYVRVDIDTMDISDPELSAAMGIIAIEGGGAQPAFGWWSDANTPILEATNNGARHVCCLDIPTGWSSGTTGGGSPILLEPGQTLWVGLAAYQWNDGDVAHFTVSAQAILSRGTERTGDRVTALDLYKEATRAGVSATALGRHVVAQAGDLNLRWSSEQHGLFLLQAWADEGTATLGLSLPGLAPATHRITNHEGVYAMTYRPGEYNVKLTELEGPLAAERPWITARVFFAEIDVPADAAFIYP